MSFDRPCDDDDALGAAGRLLQSHAAEQSNAADEADDAAGRPSAFYRRVGDGDDALGARCSAPAASAAAVEAASRPGRAAYVFAAASAA